MDKLQFSKNGLNKNLQVNEFEGTLNCKSKNTFKSIHIYYIK